MAHSDSVMWHMEECIPLTEEQYNGLAAEHNKLCSLRK